MRRMLHEFKDLSLQTHTSRVMLRIVNSTQRVSQSWSCECQTGTETQTDTEEEKNCGFQLSV